jgi:SAM-dependent methyltransferase
MSAPDCRACGAPLALTLIDFGAMPSANAYLRAEDLAAERRWPLHVRVCETCWLVQADAVLSPRALFEDYAYFSSYSASWVEHARRYAEHARARFALTAASLVVEIASNDGYLLRHFRDAGVAVLGIEPARNVAAAAIAAGIPTETQFFGRECARALVAERGQATLVVANNVLAHVPDLHDFVAGLALLVEPEGWITLEFPHLLALLGDTQFDTLYHEHFCYFSLLALEPVLHAHGLVAVDVDVLSTHGGSLRLYVRRRDAASAASAALAAVRARERAAGLTHPAAYAGFAEGAARIRAALREFVASARAGGRRIAAYGAAAKGNTLLNYCGFGTADIAYVVDANPYKQGRYLPGSHLPILAPAAIAEDRPDYLLILPWNLRTEIMTQMQQIRAWGGAFVIAVPKLEIVA